MTEFMFLVTLLSCAKHRLPTDGQMVPIETLPSRTLTVPQAAVDLWRTELRPGYRPPSRADSSAVQDLIPQLVHAAQTGMIDSMATYQASDIGMRLELWEVAGSENLVLSELPDQRHGAGAYLFSVDHPISATSWILWEAPHPYYDRRTGNIAADEYFDPPPGPAPAAFFTSSLNRYTQSDGRRKKRTTNPADPCHNAQHLFNIATLAAASAAPGATVVQIHGFSSADDEGNRPPADASGVVSAGQPDLPTPLSTAVAAALVSRVDVGVMLYPTQSKALGATTNVEMLGLEAVPSARFTHIELSDGLRARLAGDPSLRDAFGSAVFSLSTDASPSLQNGNSQ